MFQIPSWRRAEWLIAGLLSLSLATTAARADNIAAVASALPVERLVLAATVNGEPAAEPVVVRRQGPIIRIRTADLRLIGVAARDDAVDTVLNAVPGLSFRIDEATQTIDLTQGEGAVQHLRVHGVPPPSDRPAVTPGGWGAALNYDVAATRAPYATTVAGLVDAALYTPHGHGYAGAIVSAGQGLARRHLTRLDTGFTLADPNRARRLTLGDFIGGASDRSRPVRMLGVQANTDWTLRPDLVTFPIPTIDGQAAVPSTVDLVVNGSRRTAGDVKAGQFAVADVPVQTGVNSITVAVRDALGRETRQTVSTYASRDLLRPGLTAYSFEAGLVRTGYGTIADRYNAFAASGTLRTGVTDRVTLEGHAEVAPRVKSAELAASAGLGGFGLVNLSVAASAPWRTGHGGAVSWSAGYERVARPVSVAVRYLRYSREWHDLASDYGGVTRSHQLVLNIGFDLGRFGTAGASLIDLGAGHLDRPAPGQGRLAGASLDGYALDRSTLAVATYSVRVARRFNIVGTAGADVRRRASGYVSLGALMTFGSRSSAYAGVLQRAGGASATADYVRSAVAPGDLGYRADVAAGNVGRVAAGVEYQGTQGHLEAQVERTAGQIAARVEARGALVVTDGAVLATDRLTDGFAIVDTGRAGLTIYRDNRRVGVTGRRGRLVVANLRAFERSKLSIDPLQLGPDDLVDAMEAIVIPAERSGVPVRFNVRAGRAALIRVVGEDGAPIPAGAHATVNDRGDMPVGMGGQIFAPDLEATNVLTVRIPGGGACTARFAAPARPRPGVVLGPIACLPVRIARR